jgi:hypothetical protein
MKTALGALTALLLAGAMYIQPAHAQFQVQPAPGFSVQIGPQSPPPPREEWREREGFYGSGREDRREERWREERRHRCAWIANPVERHECFANLR